MVLYAIQIYINAHFLIAPFNIFVFISYISLYYLYFYFENYFLFNVQCYAPIHKSTFLVRENNLKPVSDSDGSYLSNPFKNIDRTIIKISYSSWKLADLLWVF